jgi:hypothetical protein
MYTEAISQPFLIKRDLNDFPTNHPRRTTWHKTATPLSSVANLAINRSFLQAARQMVKIFKWEGLFQSLIDPTAPPT